MSSQLLTAQQSVTASAVALNSGTATAFTNGIVITNSASSAASVFIGIVGVTISTGLEIPSGSSVVLPIQDVSSLYVIAVASSGNTISWLGIF